MRLPGKGTSVGLATSSQWPKPRLPHLDATNMDNGKEKTVLRLPAKASGVPTTPAAHVLVATKCKELATLGDQQREIGTA